MKRYRFDNPASRTLFQRVKPYIFMFVGWNALAYLSWRFLDQKASEKDESWDSRTMAEKILTLTGSDTRKTKRINIFGKSGSEAN